MSDDRAHLTRRRFLAFAGAGAAAAAVPFVPSVAGASGTGRTEETATSCDVDTAQQEVGPFYVADGLVRSDVVSGEDGIPLQLTMTFTDAETCAALAGAYVDIWSANATGVYSDEASEDTTGETYLRGVQQTDSSGQVTFSTIYPGWYAGRTDHIHCRVYTGGSVTGTTYDYTDATLVHTGQIFFDADVNAAVAGLSPYSSNTVARTLNSDDRVYTQQGGSANVVTLTGDTTDGFTATIAIGVATSTTAASTGLSLVRSAAKVTAGTVVTLSGNLTDAGTSGSLADEEIDLAVTSATGATYRGTETTNAAGIWKVSFTPLRTATYKATFAGDTSYAAANSSAETVRVAYRLLFDDVPGTASASTPVRLAGTLLPADAGVLVTVREVSASGAATAVATARTNAAGRWSTRFSLTGGTHRIKATVPAGKANVAGTSRTVTIRRA